jgi:ketosteroid isomerase-like protein
VSAIYGVSLRGGTRVKREPTGQLRNDCPTRHNSIMAESNLELVQRGFGAAAQGRELPSPHGQILTFRDGKIAEMVVYPTAEEALGAARASDGAAGAG